MTTLNKRYFLDLMESKRISLRSLAAQMGLSHSQLSLTFSGNRKMQIDEAAKLSQIFGEPIHRIIEHAGAELPPVTGKDFPIAGTLSGDGAVSIIGQPKERADSSTDLPQDSIAIQCRTAGTPLDWMDGWQFFCKKPTGIDPLSIGRYCLCHIKNGSVVLATVKRGYKPGTFNLSGTTVKESVELEWCTPILMTRN